MNRRALVIAVIVALVGAALLAIYIKRFEEEASGGEPVKLLVLLLASVSLSACDLVASVGIRTWGMATTNQAGTDSTTNVTDRSGKVLEVAFDPADADLFNPVTAPAGKPRTLDVAWTGGACDMTTDITITGAGAGLAIAVKITPNGQACDAFGLPRVIRLTLSEPILPAAVTVAQS